MSITSKLIQMSFKYGDALRDRNLKIPQNVVRLRDVCYYKSNKDVGLLDIFLPRERQNPLPIIVSIHGGGWVYGNKDAYRYYCMHLAQYGFAIINFNYRLAPENKFPAALEDVNRLFQWLKESGALYDLDLDKLFVVGDSAGAQLACQYAAILTNEHYAKLFSFEPPDVTINAMGLNSGVFHPVERVKELEGYAASKVGKESKRNRAKIEVMVNRGIKDVMLDYLGTDILRYEKEMDFQSNINERFPPVFIANSVNDIVASKKPEFVSHMEDAGVHYIYKEFGQGDRTQGHVFNLDIKREEARELNKEQIEFFRTTTSPIN